MTIDYSALQRLATQAEIQAFRTKYKKKGLRPQSWAWIGLASLVLMMAVGYVVALASNGTQTFLSIFVVQLMFVAPFAIIVTIVTLSSKHRIEKLVKMELFAAANGITLRFDRPNTAYTGVIFQEGSSRTIHESYAFPDGKEIGNYSYTVGSGKSQRTYNWGYIRIKLVRKLPHMLLDAKKNNLLGLFTNLPVSLGGNETMQLEGNFNDYFTLYVPKGYERDALYVFTPDVMLAMIDHGAIYDMEVIDDDLMIYSPTFFKLDDASAVQSILAITDKIGTEIISQGDYYADERVGDRAANVVAVPGRRLKRNVSALSIAMFVIVAIYYFFEIIVPIIWPQ